MTGTVDAYWPVDAERLTAIAALLLAVPLLGLAVIYSAPRWFAWLLTVTTPLAVERLAASEPAGLRMILISLALWLTLKIVVSVESRLAGEELPAPLPWLAFATMWIGMRPAIFAPPPRPRPDALQLIARGAAYFGLGLATFVLAQQTWLMTTAWNDVVRLGLIAGMFFVAFSLMLHFGILNLLAGVWRAVGYDCRPVWFAPLRSRNLTEFWGNRWNRAFSELAALAISRPLSPVVGKPAAVFAGFLFSGIVHELAISVPVHAGYGLPTLYFTLHGGLALIERHWRIGGRLWAALWLILPLPLLFHPWFLAATVWPLLIP
jgi:alginate O-acetyltransferase complex protein AlgI